MSDSGGWNTIESDAGVFTHLIEELGVKDVQFEELVSLDVESLQQLSPLYGVIFLFKYPTATPYRPDPSTPQDGTFSPDASSTLFFAHQSIQNACGTQAILSILLNNDATSPPTTTNTAPPPTSPQPRIALGPTLTTFKEFTSAFPPDIRGDALSNSAPIRTSHNSFARSSPFVDEVARDPDAETEDVYHFIAYTAVDGVLYELDGLQPHPISHGPCGDGGGEDWEEGGFAAAVVPVLQRRIGRYSEGEIRFNLLACCRDVRIRAREVGDWEGVERAEAVRKGWLWENALRRWNFLGFVGELVKIVGREVEGAAEGRWEEWVGAGRERTRKRLEERRARRAAADMDID